MFTTNEECRICKGKNLTKFISLGDQPPANRFIKEEERNLSEPSYPLDVYFCADCNLAQLRDVVDKEELFKNYIYFSSGMPKLSNHFQKYAEDVMRRFLGKGDFVVELASNDGILLKFFQDNGYKILGIDPASNVVKIAESMGVRTRDAFFSKELAAEIAAKEGKAKAILANNVVAHINDHHDLAQGIKTLLADDGVFVIEAPYLVDMFDNLSYDTIYHEHLSLLALRPVQKLFGQFGLEVFDMEVNPVQGQSLRVFVGHAGARPVSPNVQKYVDLELQKGFDKLESYRELAHRIENSQNQLIGVLRDLKKQGKRIAAYGAPAKGNTLLNYCQIGADVLDYALEDLPSKQGLLSPGMHIPVKDRKYTESHRPDYYLLLAWNYLNPILEKEAAYRAGGGKFIMPIGDEIKII